MAIIVWDTSVGSGNWSTPGDWVGGVAPATNDDVSIPGTGAVGAFTVTYDVGVPPALDSLTIGDGSIAPITLAVGGNTLSITGNGPGATNTLTLTEAGGATVTLSGGIITGGNLQLNA